MAISFEGTIIKGLLDLRTPSAYSILLMQTLLFLILGGSLGTLSRYYLSTWVADRLGTGFPFGTMTVNLIGCFVIGWVAGLPQGSASLSQNSRLLLVVGFLGGFTTFSSYAYESFMLLTQGFIGKAILNLLGSVCFGLLAVLLGYAFMRFGMLFLKGNW